MLKDGRNCVIRPVAVCLFMLLLLTPCATHGESTLPFIRIDMDDPDYWRGELSSVRLIAGQLYEFQEVDAKYRIEPDF